MSKKVLIACEFSGVVREAFNAYQGIKAISCDLLPPEDGRVDYHYQGNVKDILTDYWDMMIFFAPCTFLANSGVRWLYNRDGTRNGERWVNMYEATEFFNSLLYSGVPLIAGENPIQHKHARVHIRKYDQIIQPYQFGHPEQKATCLWLKGLPKLKPTCDVYDKMMKLPKNKRERVHYASPSDDRWMERSRAYSGIAQAMAKQWIPVLLGEK